MPAEIRGEKSALPSLPHSGRVGGHVKLGQAAHLPAPQAAGLLRHIPQSRRQAPLRLLPPESPSRPPLLLMEGDRRGKGRSWVPGT